MRGIELETAAMKEKHASGVGIALDRGEFAEEKTARCVRCCSTHAIVGNFGERHLGLGSVKTDLEGLKMQIDISIYNESFLSYLLFTVKQTNEKEFMVNIDESGEPEALPCSALVQHQHTALQL